MNKHEGDVMSGTFEDTGDIPVENLRFEEIPPEIQEAMEHADDPVGPDMFIVMGQMLEDVSYLTVALERANTLLETFSASLSIVAPTKFPKDEMAAFINSNHRLLKQISETYVPQVDESAEPE
jgi:hypothetical protein